MRRAPATQRNPQTPKLVQLEGKLPHMHCGRTHACRTSQHGGATRHNRTVLTGPAATIASCSLRTASANGEQHRRQLRHMAGEPANVTRPGGRNCNACAVVRVFVHQPFPRGRPSDHSLMAWWRRQLRRRTTPPPEHSRSEVGAAHRRVAAQQR